MANEKKALPIGVEFFRDFKENNFYYVDKTFFIVEFIKTRGVVNLFTRPRRFGKSLNMDMFKTFFEIGADAPMRLHWENSSSNAIVRDILEDATEVTKGEIEALISGETVRKEVIPELTYIDLGNKNVNIRQTYLWSVLYYTGYLTDAGKLEGRHHRLEIPNKEIHRIYINKIRTWFEDQVTGDTKRWERFCEAVRTGGAKTVEDLLNTFLSESISIRDTAVRKEKKKKTIHKYGLACYRKTCRVAYGKE